MHQRSAKTLQSSEKISTLRNLTQISFGCGLRRFICSAVDTQASCLSVDQICVGDSEESEPLPVRRSHLSPGRPGRNIIFSTWLYWQARPKQISRIIMWRAVMVFAWDLFFFYWRSYQIIIWGYIFCGNLGWLAWPYTGLEIMLRHVQINITTSYIDLWHF